MVEGIKVRTHNGWVPLFITTTMRPATLFLIAISVFLSPALPAHAKPKPGSKPPGKDLPFGGPKAWYQAGNSLGKRDRKEGRKPNPDRYRDQFDKQTEAEFKRGYMDAFR